MFRLFALGLAVAAFVLGRQPCLGQSVLSGSVIDADGEPVPGALVRLYQEDSTSLLRYSKTDTKGTWQMQNLPGNFYLLKIASLGHETWQQRIFVKTRDSVYMETILLPSISRIGIVQISAERLGVVVRGDTTFYNIQAFTDSTEFDLRDVLNKLPLISVDANGSIRYKGQRVDVVLTNGKDIFGQLHQQMTEGIRADDIESIQIISNFQGYKQEFALTNKEEIALNVELKKQAADRINGDAGLRTNLVGFHEANATAYKTGEKTSFATLLRVNNTAQPTLSGADFFALIDLDRLSKNQDPAEIEKYLPLFSPIIDERRNNDGLGFVRFIVEPSTSWAIKTSLLYTNFNRFAERVSTRVYLPENSIFAGVKRREQPSSLLQANVQSLYQKNRLYLDFHTAFALNRLDQTNRLSGQIDSNLLKSDYHFESNSIGLSPGLQAKYKPDSLHALVFRVYLDYKSDQEVTGILAESTLFDLPDTTLKQTSQKRRTLTNTSLLLTRNQGRHEFDFTAGFQRVSFEIDLRTQPDAGLLWENASRIIDQSPYLEARFRRKTGVLRYALNLQSTIIRRIYGHSGTSSRFLTWQGHSGVYLDFTQHHNLYLNWTLTATPPPPNNLIQARRIIGENNYRVESLDSSRLVQTNSLNLDWANRKPSGAWDYQCRLGFSWHRNAILYFATAESTYFISQSYFSPKAHRASLDVNGRYRIDSWKTTLAAKGSIEFSNEYVPVNTELLQTNFHRMVGGIRMTCSAIPKLALSAGYTLDFNQRTYPTATGISGFWNNSLNSGLQFKSGSWQFGVSLHHQRQSSRRAVNKLWLCDFSGEFTLPNTPVRLQLVGRNVLNLNGVQMIVPDFSAAYIGFDSFQTIGGQIMGGIKWIF